MKNKARNLSVLLGLVAVSAAACSSNRVESRFGDAVESNVRAQIYDRETLAGPSAETAEGTDGQRMEAVMEAHRGQKGSAQAVSEPIVINVGN